MRKTANELWADACQLEENGKLDEAIKAYESAVAAGSVEAMISLANIYDDQLTPPKSEEATLLYAKAAALGNSLGAWNLYRHFLNLGDNANARIWLKTAAKLGDEDAMKLIRK